MAESLCQIVDLFSLFPASRRHRLTFCKEHTAMTYTTSCKCISHYPNSKNNTASRPKSRDSPFPPQQSHGDAPSTVSGYSALTTSATSQSHLITTADPKSLKLKWRFPTRNAKFASSAHEMVTTGLYRPVRTKRTLNAA